MRNHETTFSPILSPAVGSYELILVTVVTCLQLKERDVSLDLPGPLTVTEHPGKHATQRSDPLLKQHKLSFSHLQALAPASPAASNAHPFPPCFFPALVPVTPLPGSLLRSSRTQGFLPSPLAFVSILLSSVPDSCSYLPLPPSHLS